MADLDREIALDVASGNGGDLADAAAQPGGRDPGEHDRPRERRQQPDGGCPLHRVDLVVDLRERQGEANDAEARLIDRDRDVQQVALDRGAEAACDAPPAGLRELDLRPRAVVLHGGQRGSVLRRVADYAPVRRDQRHAGAQGVAERVGLPVELRDGRRRPEPRDEIRHETRLGQQVGLDAGEELALERPGDQRRRHEQARAGDAEGGEEQARAERHGRWGAGSTSL